MALPDILCGSLFVSLTAAGLVMLIRQLRWIDTQMLLGKKPWACNLCMSFWTTLLVSGACHLVFGSSLISAIPAFGATLLLVNILGSAQTKPNFLLEEIPEKKDEDLPEKKDEES